MRSVTSTVLRQAIVVTLMILLGCLSVAVRLLRILVVRITALTLLVLKILLIKAWRWVALAMLFVRILMVVLALSFR